LQATSSQTRELTILEAVGEALSQEMEQNKDIIIIGEDVAAWGGPLGRFKGFLERFGADRIIDTPISEAGFVGAGLGAAITGLRPVVDIMFIDFFGVAADQIINQIAKIKYMTGGKMKVPLVILGLMGGGLSAAAQHSQCLYSVFVHIPGLKCVVPSTPYDAKGLMITALRQDDPVLYLEHKVLNTAFKGSVPSEIYAVPFGKAAIKREGSDLTVVGIGRTVYQALEAASILEKEGISVEVVDPRSLFPLDEQTVLNSVKKTGRLIVVDEDYSRCNMASEISSIVAEKGFNYLDAPIRKVVSLHAPVPFSPVLENEFLPNAGKIAKAAREMFSDSWSPP
jgi:pyruvate/2-oxoglutarate/acetoin dehydrogenase E1 component